MLSDTYKHQRRAPGENKYFVHVLMFTSAATTHIRQVPARTCCVRTHRHSGARLLPNVTSVKVCYEKNSHRLNWQYTESSCWAESSRGPRAAEWRGVVARRCSVSHSSCWTCSGKSAQEDGELRHSGKETEWNMRSHSKLQSPQHLKLLPLPTAGANIKWTQVRRMDGD